LSEEELAALLRQFLGLEEAQVLAMMDRARAAIYAILDAEAAERVRQWNAREDARWADSWLRSHHPPHRSVAPILLTSLSALRGE
jgi:hypothetical protein